MATRATWDVKGKASIVFFYFGDSYLTTLAQETTNLSLALEGYDYRVVLKHETRVGPFELSAAAVSSANVVETPTQANLVKCFKDVAAKGYMMDVWIFSHGSSGSFRVSTGTNGSRSTLTATEIRNELGRTATGYTQLPIRMVYQMNCYGYTLNDDWLAIGAKASAGARYVNFYPNQYGRFAKEWNDGSSLRNSLVEANTDLSRTAVQSYLSMVHAPSCNKEWGNCPFGKTVLGDDNCAEDYFTTKWIALSEWQNSQSGKENMNHSSAKIVSGDGNLTKRSTPTWYR